jgi:hypothetical protein
MVVENFRWFHFSEIAFLLALGDALMEFMSMIFMEYFVDLLRDIVIGYLCFAFGIMF